MTFFKRHDIGNTLVATIDRPPLNALTIELLEDGIALLEKLAAEPPKGGLVLTGHGTAYTAGVDTKAAAALDREGRLRLSAAIDRFAAALYRLPCALVSAVNGHAIGAGGIICLASDWTIIADAPLKIGLPEAKAGLAFPRVPTLIMEYQLEPTWRRRLALTSLLLGSHEAVSAGLADQVAEPGELVALAAAKAAELESQPAFRQIKRDQRRKPLAELDTILPPR